jgi:hypothetical protein
MWCKRSLLKVRKGKYKGEPAGTQVGSGSQDSAPQVLLAPMITYRKGRKIDSQPIIN